MEENKKELPQGITLRKDGRYMWRFKYNGQQYTGYTKRLSDAKREMRNRRYEVEHGIYSKEQNLLFDAWFTEWLNTYKTAKCKASTLNFYRNTYSRYIKPVFGKKKVKDLKPEQIQRFVNAKAKEYSKSTASTINFLLFDSLQQAAHSRIISRNPMENTTPPKFQESEKKKALSAEQQKIFLDAVKGSSYYSIYRAATLSGMRIGEALGLSWDDVDFLHEEIHITKTLCYTPEKGQYLDTPKTKASRRTIPMTSGLYELMKRRRADQKRQQLQAGEYWKPKPGMEKLVFTTEAGTPHSASNIRRQMREAIRKLQKEGKDIPDFTFHTFRHCFATRAIEAGMDPKTLQALLGHTTFAMTMDLYCDVMEETKRKEMKKIEQAL